MTQKRHLTEQDLADGMNQLPQYASLTAANNAGLASGGYFILTGQLLGLIPINYVVQKP